ncbi:hypothetical protein SAMN05216583_101143 [Selenomonas sp. KH1T6]|nr:hypothetical protein SAMN05216583_101143 [Selenomonas ruminantium]
MLDKRIYDIYANTYDNNLIIVFYILQSKC